MIAATFLPFTVKNLIVSTDTPAVFYGSRASNLAHTHTCLLIHAIVKGQYVLAQNVLRLEAWQMPHGDFFVALRDDT